MKGSSSKTKRMKAIINHNKFVSDRKFKSDQVPLFSYFYKKKKNLHQQQKVQNENIP